MNVFKLIFKKKPKQIKLGLALGSGGAKGFAELGAIRAFEENGLSFDIIGGTSIGSIIGAFIANGYSSTDILELLKSVDAGEIKNIFMMNMDTFGLFKTIDRSIGSLNIEDLKKPFCAIATCVETGEEKVFTEGSVAMALCASSSYPPFFKPVVIDNLRYIDGAFVNSIPADWVKEQGGIEAINAVNNKKAELLYSVIDSSNGFYNNPVKACSRSKMNVIWRMPSEELEAAFLKEASAAGMYGLKGHRSVGGLRASIYNAVSLENVEFLADFMQKFQKNH